MTRKIKYFRDLVIWKKGIEIVKDIYSLTNQKQRAVLSIHINIAEGFNRFHNKSTNNFYI